MNKVFTSAKEGIVRINHPVMRQEVIDIARDLNIPLQWVFDKLLERMFDKLDVDLLLVEVIADCENAFRSGNDDIPF